MTNDYEQKFKATFRINLSLYLQRKLIDSMSIWHSLIYLFLIFIGLKKYALSITNSNCGLTEYNINLLEHSKPGIKKVFDILALESSYPVIIQSHTGMDYSIIITILLQSLLKVPKKVDALLIV